LVQSLKRQQVVRDHFESLFQGCLRPRDVARAQLSEPVLNQKLRAAPHGKSGIDAFAISANSPFALQGPVPGYLARSMYLPFPWVSDAHLAVDFGIVGRHACGILQFEQGAGWVVLFEELIPSCGIALTAQFGRTRATAKTRQTTTVAEQPKRIRG